MPALFTGTGEWITDPSKPRIPSDPGAYMGQYPDVLANLGITLRDPGVPLVDYVTGLPDIDAMWSAQPAVRTVTDFIAGRIASTPLHTYRRVADSDRMRVRDTTLARALSDPDGAADEWPQSSYGFWYRVLLDKLLTDRFLLIADPQTGRLTRILPGRFRLWADAQGRVRKVTVHASGDSEDPVVVPPEVAILDYGYAPVGRAATPPLAALSQLLQEHSESVRYQRQYWARQMKMTGTINRPVDSRWSPEARDRFVAGLGRFAGSESSSAGGVLLLEDGMTYQAIEPAKAVDTAVVESRKLAMIEVANAFHIAPELIGAREGTFANVQAYRQALWGDSLGPYFYAIESALSRLPKILGAHPDDYVEYNVAAKLRGSFEEQAGLLQASTGAPWMTRNEARARFNLPAIDGGDEIVTPLNVLIGGQASPQDSAPPPKDAPTLRAKAAPGDPHVEAVSVLLARHLSRQATVLLARIAAGDPNWWQPDRWNKELADDITPQLLAIVHAAAAAAMAKLGGDPSRWNPAGVRNWCAQAGKSWASMINGAVHNAVVKAMTDPPEDHTPEQAAVVALDMDHRAALAGTFAVAVTADTTGFGTADGAKVATHDEDDVTPVKTWHVRSSNPRDSHARVNGETVPVDQRFSNGLMWPGDPAGGADEVAGCTCDTTIARG